MMFGQLWRKGVKGNEGESKQERNIKNSLDCTCHYFLLSPNYQVKLNYCSFLIIVKKVNKLFDFSPLKIIYSCIITKFFSHAKRS